MAPRGFTGHRGAVLLLGLLLLASACGKMDDDVADPGALGLPTPTATGGLSAMPQRDDKANLDPDMRQRCSLVEAFQIFNYSAHISTDRSPGEVGRLRTGVKEYEAKVSAAVPELAHELRLLAADAQRVIAEPARPGATLAPHLESANQAVLQHLRTTCKYKDG